MQPERAASRSGTNTIIRERLHAARVLRDSPGLKPEREQLFGNAIPSARKEAAGETGLPLTSLPKVAPFTLVEIMDEGFWAAPPPG